MDINTNVLEKFVLWCSQQCDGNWEHNEIVSIALLDNPGWSVQVGLSGTRFDLSDYLGRENFKTETDWLKCWVKDEVFNGVGDMGKVEIILAEFLQLVEED